METQKCCCHSAKFLRTMALFCRYRRGPISLMLPWPIHTRPQCPCTVPGKSCWVAVSPPPGPASSVLRAGCATEVMALQNLPYAHPSLPVTLTVSVIKYLFPRTPVGCSFLKAQRPVPRPAWRASTRLFSPFPVSPTGHLFTKPSPVLQCSPCPHSN